MKNAKNHNLMQFGDEILVLLCSDEPIQILVILSQFQTFKTETKLQGYLYGVFGAISHSHSQEDIFHHALNPIISKNQVFVTSHFGTLWTGIPSGQAQLNYQIKKLTGGLSDGGRIDRQTEWMAGRWRSFQPPPPQAISLPLSSPIFLRPTSHSVFTPDGPTLQTSK